MVATIGMQSARPVLALSGVIGAQLLDMALATRRLWLAPDGYTDSVVRARALKATDAPSLAAPLAMGEALDRATGVGRQWRPPQGPRMALRAKAAQDADAASMPIIALTPPLAIDAAHLQLRPLKTAVSFRDAGPSYRVAAAESRRCHGLGLRGRRAARAARFRGGSSLPDRYRRQRGRVELPLPVPQAVLRCAGRV